MFRRDPVKGMLAELSPLLELGSAAQASVVPLLRAATRQGGVIGVSRFGGQVIRAIGGVPTDGIFELASLTKPFTSALVGVLVARGLMAWNTRLSAFGGPLARLPGHFTAYALATHTAGVLAHPARNAVTILTDFNNPYGRLSPGDVLASARRWSKPPQRGKPRFAYSNLGAGALALAAAYAAGEDLSVAGYGAALRRYVTGPSQLSSLSLDIPSKDFVAPRSFLGGTSPTSFGALAGAGGLYGNAADLLDFAQGHLQGLFGAGWQAATVPFGLAAPVSAVAPGWFYSLVKGAVPIVWHTGVAHGTRTFLGVCPLSGAALVVLLRGGVPLVGQRDLLLTLALRLLSGGAR